MPYARRSDQRKRRQVADAIPDGRVVGHQLARPSITSVPEVMASLPEAVRVTHDKVEALARALADGLHRPYGYERLDTEVEEDHRDAEAVRVSAYSGLRMGELLALRWVDVDFAGSALTISRAISDGIETTTKSGQVRRVPMGDDTAAALERLSQRRDFTYPEDDLVFCNLVGRRLDSSALRRRYKRARDAAGLRPLRWHDLRHSYGSMLVAGGIDLVSIKKGWATPSSRPPAAISTRGRRQSWRRSSPTPCARPTRRVRRARTTSSSRDSRTVMPMRPDRTDPNRRRCDCRR
jgi:integrase